MVALPAAAVAELRTHLRDFVGTDSESLLFTGEKGGLLRTSNFRRAVDWSRAVKRCGLPDGFHFHDLRHTGNNLAAASGGSTRELMHRMGHSSMQAALIYQHATSDRDREIALGIDARLEKMKIWPTNGPPSLGRGLQQTIRPPDTARELRWRCGAGDGNRTRTISLEDHSGLRWLPGRRGQRADSRASSGLEYPAVACPNGTPMAREGKRS